MASNYDDDTEDDTFENTQDDARNKYGVRDANLFIIDASPPMFEVIPEENMTYFQKCFAECANILREKLAWNRQDCMGIMLFGTEKWDMSPETKNILTLQSLSVISVDMLKQVMDICENKWEYYKGISSPKSYPLDEVLWHASLSFCKVKTTMPVRRIILLTCRNDPQLSNDKKHTIRKKMDSYPNLGLQFFVIRLGNNWQQDVFYKDLEIIANAIEEDEADDYKPLTFEDMIVRVKHPARNMARLPLNFGNGVTLDIVVQTLCSSNKYIKKIKLDKETHVPLQSHSYFVNLEADNEVKNKEDDDDDEDIPLPVLASEIRRVQTFGGEDIYFTQDEVQNLYNINKPGIEVIGTRLLQIDPMYHCEAPKFVFCERKSENPNNKLLFAAILDRCEKRNLMIICTVTFRRYSPPLLYSMISSAKDGGFYLYKIPFEDCVRDLSDHLSNYIYDNDQRKPPIDTELLEPMSNIIKKIRIKYDPSLFQNPKLQVQFQNLETLALDLEPREPPPDKTLPMTDMVQERIGYLISEFNELLSRKQELDPAEPPQKKRKQTPASVLDENQMRNLVKNHEVESCTAVQLKEFLKIKNLKTSGNKAELVRRIYDYFD